jgi:hypothetical protein
MIRISKHEARKMFAQGMTFYMVAVNIHPRHATTIDKQLASEFNNDWDKLYNAFTYYNCNWETGYYPAYYKEP